MSFEVFMLWVGSFGWNSAVEAARAAAEAVVLPVLCLLTADETWGIKRFPSSPPELAMSKYS